MGGGRASGTRHRLRPSLAGGAARCDRSEARALTTLSEARPAKKVSQARAVSIDLDSVPITIIGHPWAPIGMGEQMRSHLQACTALQLHHGVFDIFRYALRTDPAHDDI